MRWQALSADRDRESQLPAFAADAVVRTFDAPEAVDTRFYEIHAKSALNRVTAKSRMPFRWTVNPYRGCSHACTYCTGGDTPILMADGCTKPMADLRPGDRVYGTQRHGTYRRYVTTEVLDHWRSFKPAYRITLEDGTELIASGDHRFLTGRGWKHVIGTEQGPLQRPHLTLNSKLMGTGAFAKPPKHTGDYQRGYLCGMIRGDGLLGSYSYERAGRRSGDVHRFRLALADREGLDRTREFLAAHGRATREFDFHEATETQRAITAIRTSARKDVLAIGCLIAWPRDLTIDWSKGFLAGIFDAEGSYSRGILRISNTDPDIIEMTEACLRLFGFPFVIEDYDRSHGLKTIRIAKGLQTHLRFFHLVDPAITRKRTIEGQAIKNKAKLKVVSIQKLLADRPLYDITTGTGDFIANGVVSHNCFARPTHKFLGLDAGRDFEREIVVKVNAPELVRAELSRKSWKREHVALGTNTDPYQWVEGRYKLMTGIWEALRDTDTPCSLVTKSPLVLRDLPVLSEIAERSDITVYLSVPTIDEQAWRSTEPHTPSPRARLEAVRKLNEAGVPAGILIAPLMPGINDDPAQVDEIVATAEAAGAVGIGSMGLHLRDGVREIFFAWLRQHRPDLIDHYERLYSRGAYLPAAEQKRLQSLVRSKRRRPPRRRDWIRRRPDGKEALPPDGGSQQSLF